MLRLISPFLHNSSDCHSCEGFHDPVNCRSYMLDLGFLGLILLISACGLTNDP
jgi:hypothetical protein